MSRAACSLLCCLLHTPCMHHVAFAHFAVGWVAALTEALAPWLVALAAASAMALLLPEAAARQGIATGRGWGGI